MIGFIEKIHKKNVNRHLNKKQAEVDRIFKEKGLTDEVLQLQLEINCIRNEEDICDENEKIYGDYVQ